jgi:hypothetical protein
MFNTIRKMKCVAVYEIAYCHNGMGVWDKYYLIWKKVAIIWYSKQRLLISFNKEPSFPLFNPENVTNMHLQKVAFYQLEQQNARSHKTWPRNCNILLSLLSLHLQLNTPTDTR